MTAQELLAELTKLSDEEQALEVVTEGCDCDGDVVSVEVSPFGTIYLRRGKEV